MHFFVITLSLPMGTPSTVINIMIISMTMHVKAAILAVGINSWTCRAESKITYYVKQSARTLHLALLVSHNIVVRILTNE